MISTSRQDSVGGGHWRIQWGGLQPPQPPPLNLKKKDGHPRGRCDSFTRMAVVIDLVVTSSHSAWLCALNCTVAV